MPNIVQTCVNYRDTGNLRDVVRELIEPSKKVSNFEYSLYNGGVISVKPNKEENLPAAIVGIYAVAFTVLTDTTTRIRHITEQKRNMEKTKPWAASTFQGLENGDLIWAQAMYVDEDSPNNLIRKEQHIYQFEHWSCLHLVNEEKKIFDSMFHSLHPGEREFSLDKNTDQAIWRLMILNKYLETCGEADIALVAPTKVNMQENDQKKAQQQFNDIIDYAKGWERHKSADTINHWKQLFNICMNYQYRPPFLKMLAWAANDIKKKDSRVALSNLNFAPTMRKNCMEGELKIFVDHKVLHLVVLPGYKFKKPHPVMKLFYRYLDLADKELVDASEEYFKNVYKTN